MDVVLSMVISVAQALNCTCITRGVVKTEMFGFGFVLEGVAARTAGGRSQMERECSCANLAYDSGLASAHMFLRFLCSQAP